MSSRTVEAWHAMLASQDLTRLDELLADDAVFHSPIVHTPQRGKAITAMYLTAAYHVLFTSGFRYVREIVGEFDAALEFTAEIDGLHVNGVDLIRWNAQGRITDFKVMIRPLKAVNLLHSLMARMLEQMGPQTKA